MKSPRMRLTMQRMMAIVAVLGINIGLVRAYAVAELAGRHLTEVNFGVFIFFALQIGLWCCLSSAGRLRRFWLGFEVSGLAATLFVAVLVLFDASPFKGLFARYWDVMGDLAYQYLPAEVDNLLENEHPTLWEAIVCFVPEFVAAFLGGLLAACLFGRTRAEGQAIGPPPGYLASDREI